MNIGIIENNTIAVNTIRKKLVNSLIKEGYDVFVFTSVGAEQIRSAKEEGFNVVNIGSSIQSPLDVLTYLFSIHRAMRQYKIDLCLTFTIRPAIFGNLVTRLLGIPTITNITGIGPLFAKNNFTYRGARFLYKFALKKSAKIFFQNYDDMDIFVKKGFARPEAVERIPGSGIDHEHYFPRERKRRDGKFNFIFISRLVKDKGIIEYVNAAQMLRRELPDASFNVLGPVWRQNLKDNTVKEAEIGQWVKRGIVNYLGESQDVRDFLGEADCVVLPSYREGLSNVLLEAASMEKPSITCNTTGCREIVEDNITGYLCKVQDAHDLADKMRKMHSLSEEERARMGERAREKVVREFDKKIVIDAYLKAIKEVSRK